MKDCLIDAPVIGERLGGKTPKTGQRFLDDWTGTVYIIRGRRYVKESDFDAWIESQRLDRPVQPASNCLKSMLEAISAKVLAKRKQGE